ncbi:MAG: competence/damage-inducible protein A [Caulobacterales bacterium]|jgi:molybdenum cofactor synthesis domain-containing protein|nr:competence/damage-inducible protein A [Caulobacterales bacterium]
MTLRQVKAAVLLIGDELLSGRTQDINLRAIAKFLAPLGVQVAEARVVSDAPEAIVAAVNELRARYDYVFTTGGIGPTHDDKTADAIAAAFAVPIGVRDDARAILETHYKGRAALNESRLRMARIPDGAALIANPVSKAPGFQIGNVFVMAGVPSIMRGMLEDIGHRIEGGAVVKSVTMRGKGVVEGAIAEGLERLETETAGAVSFGSYPWFAAGGDYGVHLVARSAEPQALTKARDDLIALIQAAGGNPEEVEEGAA